MKNDGFFTKVYDITLQIPAGRVSTYGAIARFIGSPGAARMVGWALNNCHNLEEFIPAHRVVNRNGMLSGKHHFQGNKEMQELLESEGIIVVDDKIQNFEKYFWNPNQDLV